MWVNTVCTCYAKAVRWAGIGDFVRGGIVLIKQGMPLSEVIIAEEV